MRAAGVAASGTGTGGGSGAPQGVTFNGVAGSGSGGSGSRSSAGALPVVRSVFEEEFNRISVGWAAEGCSSGSGTGIGWLLEELRCPPRKS